MIDGIANRPLYFYQKDIVHHGFLSNWQWNHGIVPGEEEEAPECRICGGGAEERWGRGIVFWGQLKNPWPCGYGSIPIDTFLVGWTSIYQLFWCSPGVQGFDILPCEKCGKWWWTQNFEFENSHGYPIFQRKPYVVFRFLAFVAFVALGFLAIVTFVLLVSWFLLLLAFWPSAFYVFFAVCCNYCADNT